MNQNDDFKHKGMRRQLIDSLREKGITDQKVLDAMMNVPRHAFLESAFLPFAYDDKPFPIGSGQTISQPYTVAFQTQLLDLKRGQKVLEIGTGSGYQAAVLCELGAKVFTIERHKPLFRKSQRILEELGYRARVFYGDGYKGKPAFGPYDRILITCGAPEIPSALLEQLAPGGILVVPLGSGGLQEMIRIEKDQEGELHTTKHGKFRFVPMIEDRADNSGTADI